MIELIVVRDPDGDTYLTVFVDGVRVSENDIQEYQIDAGRGYMWSDWCENRDAELAAASNEAVRSALRDAYDGPPGSKYIQDKPDDVGWLDPFVDEDIDDQPEGEQR